MSGGDQDSRVVSEEELVAVLEAVQMGEKERASDMLRRMLNIGFFTGYYTEMRWGK